MSRPLSDQRPTTSINAESGDMAARVLILTDDADASNEWSRVLKRHDIKAEVMGYDGIQNIKTTAHTYHEIIIDHCDESDLALHVCGTMYSMFQQPLLLLTHETNERFHMEAYRRGVVECAKKPIGIPLFVAKAQARLRRAHRYEQPEVVETLTTDGFYLDTEAKIFGTFESSVRLSDLECRLLSILMENRKKVVESDRLVRRVWFMHSDPSPRLLRNLVHRLRHKTERVSDGRQLIWCVAGVGYVFKADQYCSNDDLPVPIPL